MEATKVAEVSVQASDSLEELRRRFEQWRAVRRQGERIPEAMWMEAAKEARARSAYRVALALRLDYAMLKHRAASKTQGNGKTRVAVRSNPVAPRFVELLTPMASGTPTAIPTASATSGRAECVVVMENARGATMRVELNAAGLSGLAGVCSAFWSAR
jgi:hypothetical protein